MPDVTSKSSMLTPVYHCQGMASGKVKAPDSLWDAVLRSKHMKKVVPEVAADISGLGSFQNGGNVLVNYRCSKKPELSESLMLPTTFIIVGSWAWFYIRVLSALPVATLERLLFSRLLCLHWHYEKCTPFLLCSMTATLRHLNHIQIINHAARVLGLSPLADPRTRAQTFLRAVVRKPHPVRENLDNDLRSGPRRKDTFSQSPFEFKRWRVEC
ncbi:hypothetical protein BGW80DRAFT_1443383 [Lactifluus volemus]|nr:hypothetical protein BGW80DRAFT_1443383 [Lactifluus volemus]